MKTKKTDRQSPGAEPDAVMVACTVLVAKTQIGAVRKGQGAKVVLSMARAKTLAALDRVSIDGV